MVAAEAERRRSRADHMPDRPLDLGRHPLRVAIVENDVAPVDDVQPLERVEPRRPGMAPGKLRRGGADAARAEPAAGAVRGRGVERHPDHRQVHALEIARIPPPAEAQRPREHLLVMGAGAVALGQEGIALAEFWHARSPVKAPLQQR